MRLIVSLTSYPPRIGCVHKVIESLFNQTVKADEIILYLSLEEFPNEEEDLPDVLRKLIGKKGFRIEWVKENLKSHKKYYYALQQYREDTVITVDDDMIYAETMINDLIREYRRFPYAVSARRVRIILRQDDGLESYSKWDGILDEYAGIPRMDILAIGVGGICYPPRTGNEDWFRKKEMMSIAGEQDDLWLKYNEILDHMPIVYALPLQKDIVIDCTRGECLFRTNLYGGNDNCVGNLLEMMRARDYGCYESWFQNLMYWKEYAERKRKYYENIVRADFDKVQDLPIYFYGAGIIAEHLLGQLCELRLIDAITAVLVSDRIGNPSELKGIVVRQLDEIDKEKRFAVIFGISETNRYQVETTVLKGYDYCTIELNEKAITKYFNIIRGWQ